MSTQARECSALPSAHAGAGVASFRRNLSAQECATIDEALAIVGRCLRDPGRMECTAPAPVGKYLCLRLGGEPMEVFGALYLDSTHRAIVFERVAVGTLNQAIVYPRTIVEAAIRHNAVAVILAHNHPSGNTASSRADRQMTRSIGDALRLIDCRLLDHLIVSGNRWASMAQEGEL